MNFKAGDMSVHPRHEVIAVEPKLFGEVEKDFYVLEIAQRGLFVMVATDGAARLGPRRVVSRKRAKAVLETLRSRERYVTSKPWNRRFRPYTTMVNSGSLDDVAKVLCDLSRTRIGKDLSFGELVDQQPLGFFQQHDIAPTFMGEVIGDATTHDPATHDDHACRSRHGTVLLG